jgi:hypothetical protein
MPIPSQPIARWFLAALSLSVVSSSSPAVDVSPSPAYQEIIGLLRTYQPGIATEALDKAAVEEMLSRYSTRVALLANPSAASASGPLLSRSNLLDDAYGYLRVAQVERGLVDEFQNAYQKLAGEKKLKGLVLDLRFAGGIDYSAAVELANLFIADDKPQLQLDGAVLRSKAKENALTLSLTILVNGKTAGAAEVLAALLRENRAGLLLGSATEGSAFLHREFTLSSGQRLRLATTPVKFGNGQPVAAAGLKPDIQVDVSLDNERQYFADAYKEIALATRVAATTNSAPAAQTAPRKRINEAELVRRQREGLNSEEDTVVDSARGLEKAKPLLRDPALARALDLLKGLAVVRQANRAGER